MTRQRAPRPGHAVRRAAAHRDRAIVAIRHVTSWVAGGAALATGVLIGLAAHDTPNHHASAPNQGGGTSNGGQLGQPVGSSGSGGYPGQGAGQSFSQSGGTFSPVPSAGAPQAVTGQT